MSHTKRFSVAQNWDLLLRDAGLSPGEVLRRARLPADLFARRDAQLKPAEYFRLWKGMEDTTKDVTFPLTLVSAMSAEFFDPLLFAAFCSPNLNVALQRLSCFKPLLAPARLMLDIGEQNTRLEVHMQVGELALPESLVAAEMAFFVQLARMATRERVSPLALGGPADLSDPAFGSFFDCQPKHGKVVSLTFSATDAARPFVTENAGMWAFFEPELRKRLAELDADAAFADQVHGVLLEALPSGRASADEVASQLAVSKRTLQRRLLAEGTNFQAVLNKVREELARHYLTQSDMPGSQIAFLLGFDDPNSYFRAFHGWTGMTPEQVRAEGRH